MGKIGFISPYAKGCDLAREIAEEVGVEIVCAVSVGENAVTVANQMFEQENVSAIVDRYPTSNVLVRRFGSAKIIEIGLSNYALIQALNKAREYGKRIAYVTLKGHGSQGADIEFLQEILDIKLEIIEMHANGDQVDVADALKAQGYLSAVSAAACLRPLCRERGIHLFLIPLDREVLTQGIKAAASIAELVEQTDKVRAYLDSEENGIIIIDDDDVIRVCNRPLSRIMHLDKNELLGRSLKEAAKMNLLLQGLFENKHVIKYQKKVYYTASFHYNDIDVSGTAIKVISLESDLPFANISQTAVNSGFKAKHQMSDIIGSSVQTQTVKKVAKRFANTDSTILIAGESGVGKELFAQAIHNASRWKNGPFIALNCAALPENLLESELYGYVDGAFTGARRGGKVGLFELSQGGTLFLDEIGEIPLERQARLLRALQEKQIIRLGGTRAIQIDNRIICATNRNLRSAVQEGTFRADLYYRINVLELNVPPLRERLQDIDELVPHFALDYRTEDGSSAVFSQTLLDAMKRYQWPGNIRELCNITENIVVTSAASEITEEHFWEQFQFILSHGITSVVEQHSSSPEPVRGTLKDAELQMIRQKYEEFGYNTKATAEALGISRTTLWRKLKKLSMLK